MAVEIAGGDPAFPFCVYFERLLYCDRAVPQLTSHLRNLHPEFREGQHCASEFYEATVNILPNELMDKMMFTEIITAECSECHQVSIVFKYSSKEKFSDNNLYYRPFHFEADEN